MTTDQDSLERLRFLARVVLGECDHLMATDQRLFTALFSIGAFDSPTPDAGLSERVEAFVARFSRLPSCMAVDSPT